MQLYSNEELMQVRASKVSYVEYHNIGAESFVFLLQVLLQRMHDHEMDAFETWTKFCDAIHSKSAYDTVEVIAKWAELHVHTSRFYEEGDDSK